MARCWKGNPPVSFTHRVEKLGRVAGLKVFAGFDLYFLDRRLSAAGQDFLTCKLVAREPQKGRGANYWVSLDTEKRTLVGDLGRLRTLFGAGDADLEALRAALVQFLDKADAGAYQLPVVRLTPRARTSKTARQKLEAAVLAAWNDPAALRARLEELEANESVEDLL